MDMVQKKKKKMFCVAEELEYARDARDTRILHWRDQCQEDSLPPTTTR